MSPTPGAAVDPDDDIPDDLPDDVPAAPPGGGRGGGRGGGSGSGRNDERSASAEALGEAADKNIYDFLTELRGESRIMLKLKRISPKEWEYNNKRIPIAGALCVFDEPFTEEEIHTRFGGGKYQVLAHVPKKKGSGWVYAGAQTFEISGPPRLTAEILGDMSKGAEAAGGPNNRDTSLEKQAMAALTENATAARQRAWDLEDRARDSGKLDTGLLDHLTAPLRAQADAMERRLETMTKMLSEKDSKILDLVTRKPDSTAQDRIFEKLVDGDSARIDAVRTQFDSERRQLMQSHSDELRSTRERHADEMKSRERAHEREIEQITKAINGREEAIKLGYEGRIDGLKGRIADLERQLGKAETKVDALEAIKTKSPIDQMTELATLKDSMESLGLTGGQEEGSTWERIVTAALESPLLKAVATRVESAPAAPSPVQTAPVQRRTLTPAQRKAAMDARGKAKAQAAAAAADAVSKGATPEQANEVARAVAGRVLAAAVQAVPVEDGPARVGKRGGKKVKVDPAQVAIAITFMEAAVRNGTDPASFAESIKSMVPKEILTVLKEKGADRFLSEVAKLEDNSPLATQSGRNFMRKVAKVLVEGIETPAAPSPPVEPSAAPEAATVESLKAEAAEGLADAALADPPA